MFKDASAALKPGSPAEPPARSNPHPRRNAYLPHELADRRRVADPGLDVGREAIQLELGGRLRLRVQKALTERAAELSQLPVLPIALDSLRDHCEVELVGQREDRGHDRAVVARFGAPVDEEAGDLDVLHRAAGGVSP